MDGYQGFLKMQEITKHLRSEIDWWHGEGLDLSSIAVVLRSLAKTIDPAAEPKQSWGEQWASSEGYRNAMEHISRRDRGASEEYRVRMMLLAKEEHRR